ncbi:MAG: hypothetical protein WA210_07780, partial [Burkholderiaceae bacterium]
CPTQRRLAASLALCAASASTLAQTPDDERGFSYFMGLGAQSTTYRETPSTFPAKSHARVTNPLLITGAVYAIDTDLLLSLDGESTFAPGTTTERWTATVPVINGVTLADSLLQTNSFTLQETTTRLLLHYRVRDQLFAVGGPSFHSQSFKRYAFTVLAPSTVIAPPTDTVVEESASEVMVHGGLALESERVRNSRNHYNLRATVGVPMWRRVENTQYPGRTFSKIGGYELGLAGRYSYAVTPRLHVGLWGQMLYSQRQRQVNGNLELPESTLSSVGAGLELLWKL